MRNDSGGLTAVFSLIFAFLPIAAAAQSAQNVAVVVNTDSEASRRVGEHYARVRGIPDHHVISIRTPIAEAVTGAVYKTTIEAPIAASLSRHGLQDRILYLVLTKDVPLKITNAKGATVASVDSTLTLLYRQMTGAAIPTGGRIPNPYYLGAAPVNPAPPFSHRQHDIYLVTRLDAFTVDEALALIDRAQAKAPAGPLSFVLDQRGGVLNNPTGDLWLGQAGRRLRELKSVDVLMERKTAVDRKVADVVGYYSWGSVDPKNRVRRRDLPFAPGALAASFESGDARTFREPPDNWMPTANWQDQGAWFEGAPGSLVGDLIRDGVTGVAGYVGDPFLQSTVRPDILFPAYAAGLNLAEAFYAALPHLAWQSVIVGDPLCVAFPRRALTQADIEEPIAPETGLPALFGQRRLAVMQAAMKTAPAEALQLLLQAEAHVARGETDRARTALERATNSVPNLVAAQLELALLHERAGDIGRALERYERVLALDPKNVIALNNLAYGMAVHRHAPRDARPFAVKAVELAGTDPNVTDTFAWIEHLLGNTTAAQALIRGALRGAPDNAVIHVHAAFIFAAAGAADEAKSELATALELDPTLRNRTDVQELEQRLRTPDGPSREERLFAPVVRSPLLSSRH